MNLLRPFIRSGIFLVAVLMFIPAFLAGADDSIQVIEARGEYVMGDGETPAAAEERARHNAMRAAAEQAGIYLRSYTKVRNMALEDDIVEAVANHSMKVTVQSRKREMMGDAFRFIVVIKAELSNREIDENLRRAAERPDSVAAERQTAAEFDRLNREIELLKKKLVDAESGQKKALLLRIAQNERQYRANLLLEEGRRQFLRLQHAAAAASFSRAIELDPGLAAAYAERARANLWPGSTDELLKDVNRAIALEPTNAMFYAIRAEVVGFRHCSPQKPERCGEVQADIEKAISLAPDMPGYRVMLGNLYLHLGKYNQAAREFDKVVAAASAGKMPSAAAGAYVARAEFAMKAAEPGYLNRALDDMDKAIEIITADRSKEGDIEKLLMIQNIMMTSNPSDKKEPGRLLIPVFGRDPATFSDAEQKDWKARLELAEKTRNERLAVFYKRAGIRYEAGDVEGAESDRQAACRYNVGEAIITAERIVISHDFCSAKRKFLPFADRKALEAYQAIERGMRFFSAGSFNEAIAEFGKSISLKPDYAQAYFRRGYTYYAVNSFQKALKDIDRAAGLEPENYDFMFWYGKVNVALKKDLAALEAFTKSLALAERNKSETVLFDIKQILYHRAGVYSNLGRHEQAAADYDLLVSKGDYDKGRDKARSLALAGRKREALQAFDAYLVAARAQQAEMGEAADEDLKQQIEAVEQERQQLAEGL